MKDMKTTITLYYVQTSNNLNIKKKILLVKIIVISTVIVFSKFATVFTDTLQNQIVRN